MKNFKILMIILFSLAVFAKEPSLTTAESLAHVKLKKAFQLPNGPATNMSSFYIKDIGVFFVLNCDLSFNSSLQTPFGPTKPMRKENINVKDIVNEMKETLLEVEQYVAITDKEKLFLIVIDSKVFKNPFSKSTLKKIYKVSMDKGNKDLNKIEIN